MHGIKRQGHTYRMGELLYPSSLSRRSRSDRPAVVVDVEHYRTLIVVVVLMIPFSALPFPP